MQFQGCSSVKIVFSSLLKKGSIIKVEKCSSWGSVYGKRNILMIVLGKTSPVLHETCLAEVFK